MSKRKEIIMDSEQQMLKMDDAGGGGDGEQNESARWVRNIQQNN